MKKVILAIALSVAGFGAFAQSASSESTSLSGSYSQSGSVAGASVNKSGNSSSTSGASVSGVSSTAAGGSATGGTSSVSGVSSTSAGGTATGSNVNNISCLVNCTDPTASTKALADSTVQAAAITAQAMRDVAGTTQVIKNTPSVNGPNLTSSNDTCMGSTSGSVNIAGLGIGGGTSWVDGNCKMLKNSRELWNMGMKAAALALMCTDSANRDALELTGYVCPQTEKANKQASAAAVSTGYNGSDPIVRARLGMTTDNQVAAQ